MSREKAGVGPTPFNLSNLPSDLPGLLSVWRQRRPEDWAKDPGFCAEAGKRFLGLGEPVLAYDLFQAGLTAFPKNSELLRLLALSLARSGAPGRACQILTELHGQGRRDEETMGMLARTHKDLAVLAATPKERDAQRKLSCVFYMDSYRAQGGYYAGINAAALFLMLGRRGQARRLALEVRAICLARTRRAGSSGEAYWLYATLGESSLILGDWPQAEDWYGRAAQAGRGRYADISSTRRQARMLLDFLGRDPSAVNRSLRIPRVIPFTGHLLDQPGRLRPRFPASAEAEVRAEIAGRLKACGGGFGYSSAACGSDILFLEEMLKRGGEVHVVLPCSPAEFRKTSVDVAPGGAWGARFERVLRRASGLHVANDHGRTPGNIGYVYANLIIDGLAKLKAASLDSELSPLAVWDGEKEAGAGGTGSLVRHWRRQGLVPEIIALAPRGRFTIRAARPSKSSAETQKIKAVLFADVVGYSKLTDEQIPIFLRNFMEIPGRMLRGLSRPPKEKATWGDALYLVFDDLEDAGLFALELSDRIRRVSWTGFGLPRNLTFRISLHAGPIYRLMDPVTGRPCFTGAHVTRGARIEPISPPGQIYASEAFAALSASRSVRGFACDYVGQVPLAKKFGSWPLYHLRRVS